MDLPAPAAPQVPSNPWDLEAPAVQSATVRVISATSTRPVTYDDLAAAWDSGNYASLQAAWSALTYDDMAADPLRGAPNA